MIDITTFQRTTFRFSDFSYYKMNIKNKFQFITRNKKSRKIGNETAESQ